MGVAFSLGFIFGPIIGVVFSMLGREVLADSFRMYQYPACFALSLAIIDIIFIAKMFQETLPPEKRVRKVYCLSLSFSRVITTFSLTQTCHLAERE